MRSRTLLMACFLLVLASPVNAEFYRWIDKDGKENFTNDPNKIPREYRSGASPLEVHPGKVAVAETPADVRPSRREGSEHRDRNGKGEDWWRKRAENLRQEIRDLEDERELVLKKEQEQERKAGGKKSKSKTNYEHKKMQIEKKITQARRRLEVDLPEEARKADAYPGWLRE